MLVDTALERVEAALSDDVSTTVWVAKASSWCARVGQDLDDLVLDRYLHQRSHQQRHKHLRLCLQGRRAGVLAGVWVGVEAGVTAGV